MLMIGPFSLIEEILTVSSIEHGEAEVVAVNDPFIETHYAVRIYPMHPPLIGPTRNVRRVY